MREIITVQLGSYSNFVGAHYWNIQVCYSVCHSLHRTSQTCSYRCFRPFLFIQDELLGLDGTDGPFKSALQCLPPEVLMTERELQDGTIAMVPRCIIVDKMGGLGSWGPSGSVLAPGCAPEVVANTTELPTWVRRFRRHAS